MAQESLKTAQEGPKRPKRASIVIIITTAIIITIIAHPPGVRRPTKLYSIDNNNYLYMDR